MLSALKPCKTSAANEDVIASSDGQIRHIIAHNVLQTLLSGNGFFQVLAYHKSFFHPNGIFKRQTEMFSTDALRTPGN